jgi:hypothetical protein
LHFDRIESSLSVFVFPGGPPAAVFSIPFCIQCSSAGCACEVTKQIIFLKARWHLPDAPI